MVDKLTEKIPTVYFTAKWVTTYDLLVLDFLGINLLVINSKQKTLTRGGLAWAWAEKFIWELFPWFTFHFFQNALKGFIQILEQESDMNYALVSSYLFPFYATSPQWQINIPF